MVPEFMSIYISYTCKVMVLLRLGMFLRMGICMVHLLQRMKNVKNVFPSETVILLRIGGQQDNQCIVTDC